MSLEIRVADTLNIPSLATRSLQALLGAVDFQGTWNATTNSPAIPAAAVGNDGWYYVVAVAGTTSIDGVASWEIGDWIISNGTAWFRVASPLGNLASEAEAGDFYGGVTNPSAPYLSKAVNVLRVHNAIRSGEPVHIKRDFGAVGEGDEDDALLDTAAFQDCFAAMAAASETLAATLPAGDWTTPVGGRPWYQLSGRSIGGVEGGAFNIVDELDIKNIFGLKLEHATFIARDDGNWDATKSVLNCKSTTSTFSAPAQTLGYALRNLTIDCNALCNGLYDIGGRLNRILSCKIWGFAAIANGWGIKVDGGLEYMIDDNKVYGRSILGMSTAVPTTPNSATGMILDCADSEISRNKVFRASVGVKMTEAGIIFAHNHVHGFATTADAPAIIIDKTTVGIVHVADNYIDSGIVRISGPRGVAIVDNQFILNSIAGMPTPTRFLQMVAQSAGEVIEDFTFEGNQAIVPLQDPSPGATWDRAITFSATADPGGGLPYFSDHRSCRVGDNLFKSTTSAPRGIWEQRTHGGLSVTIATANFTGNNTFIDLADYLFLPNAAAAPFRIKGMNFTKTSDNTAQVPTAWNYNRTTSKLMLTFTAPFTGTGMINFEWGEQSRVLASAAS